MRFFFLILLFLMCFLILSRSNSERSKDEIPIFLKEDTIVLKHYTKSNIKFESQFKPNLAELEILKNDISGIWAHLNHLYNTNDVEAGKEYYSEAWFKQICSYHGSSKKQNFTRQDLEHKVVIKNWASDGLVCTLTDSVKVVYRLPNSSPKTLILPVAMVLLFQGDHWRIDALKVLKKVEN